MGTGYGEKMLAMGGRRAGRMRAEMLSGEVALRRERSLPSGALPETYHMQVPRVTNHA